MGYFEELLGTRRTLELAFSPFADEGTPVTVKETPEIPRVDPKELEITYVTDSITFNSINLSNQIIMSAGCEIKAENQTIQKYFTDFLDNIGLVGEDITFTELLQAIFQNQFIYGNAYVELVYNKNMSKIVDLVSLDPKRMDYARAGDRKIVLDKYGKPVGYTQKIPWGVSKEGLGDPKPDRVNLDANEIFIKPERIAHFKLYTYGDRFYGVGRIEPAYKDIIYAKNIKEAQANSIYARGTYPLIDYVGDQDHYPTPNQLKEAVDQLSKMKHSRYFALPFWHDIQPLEVKQSDIVQDTLEFLRESQTASLGMPLAFATGSGEKTNRATLSNQQRLLEYTLRDIVNRTIANFRKYIFKRICMLENFDEIPTITWGYLGAEEINEKAKRIVDYVNSGIMLPEEAKDYAIKSENLK